MMAVVSRAAEPFEIHVRSGGRRQVERAMRQMAELLDAQMEVTPAGREALAASR